MNRTLKIAGLALVAVLVLWACGKEMSASESAEKFLTAIQNADWDTAKQYATEDTKGAIDLLSGSEETAAPKTVAIVGEEVNGEEATVTYTLDGGAEQTVVMKKNGGKWEAVMEKADIQKDLGQETIEDSLMDGMGEAMEGIGEEMGEAMEGAMEGEGTEEGAE